MGGVEGGKGCSTSSLLDGHLLLRSKVVLGWTKPSRQLYGSDRGPGTGPQFESKWPP